MIDRAVAGACCSNSGHSTQLFTKAMLHQLIGEKLCECIYQFLEGLTERTDDCIPEWIAIFSLLSSAIDVC
jgi:hypothetical protein